MSTRTARPSAYRRSYGTDKKIRSASPIQLTPEMRKNREEEKEKLKKCNNRLVNYIEKVHDLETANKILAAENSALRKTEKSPQQDVAALYEDELAKLRKRVEDLQVANQKLEIEKDNLGYELEETEEKLEQEKEDRKQVEKEVKDLRKDVDDATIERVSLEGKIENLQETLQLERQAHAIELENLQSQIRPAHAPVVENEPSLMPDITDAIQSVRQQYEMFNTKNVEALDVYYKEKVDFLNKQLKAAKEDNGELRVENGEQRKRIHQLEMELEALRSKNDNLERHVIELEETLTKQTADSQEKIHDLCKELDDAKQDIGKYVKNCQELGNLKLSLEQEIAIYHKLLQGEESRVIDVEVADPKHVVRTPKRGRTGSRSSSRGGSHSRSHSRSRSRSRSSSSSSSDRAEEKLDDKKEPEEEKVQISSDKKPSKTILNDPLSKPSIPSDSEPLSPANLTKAIAQKPTSVGREPTKEKNNLDTSALVMAVKLKDDTLADNITKETELQLPIPELKQNVHDEVIVEKDKNSSKSNSRRSSVSSGNADDKAVEANDLQPDIEQKCDDTKVEDKDKDGVEISSHRSSASDDTPNIEPTSPEPLSINEGVQSPINISEEIKSRSSSESSQDEASSKQNYEESSAKDALISYLDVDCNTDKLDKPIESPEIEKITVIPLYPSKQTDVSSNQDALPENPLEQRENDDSQTVSVKSSEAPKATPENLDESSDSESNTEKQEREPLIAKVNAATISESYVNDQNIKSLKISDDDSIKENVLKSESIQRDPPAKQVLEEPVEAPIIVASLENKPSVTKQDMTETQHSPTSESEIKTPPSSPTTSHSSSSSSPSSKPSSPRSKKMSRKSKRKEHMYITKKGVVSVTWKVKGGTVRPIQPFQPVDDAERLREALKGAGTDEKTVSSILAKRTKAQRLEIAAVYKEKYDADLIEDLKDDLSGDFKNVVLHLMWKRSVTDAHALRKAIEGFGTDEAVLIEILCTQTSREIIEIKDEYAREFPGRDLEADIGKETSGAFKDFLLSVLKANRPPDSGTVVANKADADAEELYNMKVKDWSPSNPKFLEIFTKRSFEHLWFLFNQSWPKVSKDDLLETIDKECKGDLKKGLKTLIRFSVFIPPVYFAVQLHDAMKGFGTEDSQIIYIITARSEIDLIDIKEEFQAKYNTSLGEKIKKETKGDYKRILLNIIDDDEDD